MARTYMVSVSCVRNWLQRADFPAPVVAQIEGRRGHRRWDSDEVDVWFKARPRVGVPMAARAANREIGNGCVNYYNELPGCHGPVAFHQLPSESISWARCETHWREHLLHDDPDLPI